MSNKVIKLISEAYGTELRELIPGIELNPKRKDYSRAIIDTYLNNNLQSDYRDYLNDLGLVMKTTPINKGGLTSVEPLRLCSINLSNFVKENWNECELKNLMSGLLIVPLLVSAKNLGQPYRLIGKPLIWIPSEDEVELFKEDWLNYQNHALMGAIPKQRGIRTDLLTFPTESKTNFIHLKPHSVKGKFELDSFGNQVRRMAFYMNPSRLRSVLLCNQNDLPVSAKV